MITGKNYIGKDLSAAGEITYHTVNPETNTPNEFVFYQATREELDLAAEKADKAFEIYRNTPSNRKAEFLEAIATELEATQDDLTKIFSQESGLPAGRAKGEFGRTVNQLRSFARMLEEGSWVEAIISNAEGKPDLRRMLIPIGPVAVFGAGNFPFAFSTAGGDTASALASGCPVIVKSHPLHSGTGELVSRAIIKAADDTGMPDGVFSNLNSSGIEVGQWLVMHRKIKAVGFTGSIKAGTSISKLAASREEPIPVYAEMGSVNPVVILPSALEEKAQHWAEQYAGSITAGTGQFCTNPGLILGIESQEFDHFIQKLGELIGDVPPTCMLHPNIKDQYEKSKSKVLSQNGYEEVGSYKTEVKPNYAQQSVISVNAEAFLSNPVFHGEVFGPFSVVVKCKNKEELTEVIQNLEGQLTGTVLSSRDQELGDFSEMTEALKSRVGRIIFNGVPTGVEVCAAMTHGGPFPATSDSKFTSVGITAVKRWVRPVSYQDWPEALLPDPLKNTNPLKIVRTVNGEISRDAL
ncbi:MAG TPA: aldehyde dehydrogenase (NADP(+)) [Salinimicrobium sp.]|nr:aldehyde dehydrogenase (NADP(+)) [Salinimicrobium sp.]